MTEVESITLLVRATQDDVQRVVHSIVPPSDATSVSLAIFQRAVTEEIHLLEAQDDQRRSVLRIAVEIASETRRSSGRCRAIPLDDRRRSAHSARGELEDKVKELEPDQRLAFILTQFIGLCYRDAGEVLRVSATEIRRLVTRARSKLLSEWTPHSGPERWVVKVE